MKHPFWILNTSLLFFLLASAGFVALTQQPLPKLVERKKTSAKKISHDETFSVEKIYENDLFDTYHEEIAPAVEPDYATPIPTPPTPSHTDTPDEPVVPFLPPLNITLKGIMIINDESQNIVMIEDNTTKVESNYKVGDSVEDAQLVQISYNKIVLIRSNGQFETLYLSEKDVLNEKVALEEKDGWLETVKKRDSHTFEIDPVSFTDIIANLSSFINIFDIVTVYKSGKNIGCRVGKIIPKSLPDCIGIESYDIITSIAGIPTNKVDSRFEIYKKITHLSLGDTFKVTIQRDDAPVTITYLLSDLQNPLFHPYSPEEKLEEKVGIITGPGYEELEEERIKLLKDRYKFAPTTQDLLIEQREMLAKGNQERVKNFPLSSES